MKLRIIRISRYIIIRFWKSSEYLKIIDVTKMVFHGIYVKLDLQ